MSLAIGFAVHCMTYVGVCCMYDSRFVAVMESMQHGASAENNFLIIGSTVDGSGRITHEMVTDLLTRLQQSMSQDRAAPQAPVSHADVDSNTAEENDVVVEVQEFLPEEEITVVESGEIIHAKTPSKCHDRVSVATITYVIGLLCVFLLVRYWW